MTTTETYCRNLATLAMRLVGTVHDDGPNAIRAALVACRSLTPPRGINTDDALIITLAAMVNPEHRRSELLDWLTPRDGTIATLLPTKTGHYHINPIAIELAIHGALPAHSLNPLEAQETVTRLDRRGWSTDDIAHHLDTEPRHINQLRADARTTRRTPNPQRTTAA